MKHLPNVIRVILQSYYPEFLKTLPHHIRGFGPPGVDPGKGHDPMRTLLRHGTHFSVPFLDRFPAVAFQVGVVDGTQQGNVDAVSIH